MDAAALGSGLHRRLSAKLGAAPLLGLFAATLFLSALLLFSVQPMFAKIVLPRLGGSPSVWAVSMCFFQAVLLAGYCYAHALNRYAPPRLAPVIHLALLAATLLALPIGLSASAQEPPAGDAYLWLIGTLASGVGLPFFAVSANAPLLQSWFARTGHKNAGDPYFLYGASNLGSLVALLAYPFLLEPFLGVATQKSVWTVGFAGLGLGIAACGIALHGSIGRRDAVAVATAPAGTTSPRPTWRQRLSWVGLAAVPSGLLVAYSTYLTTDLASAPFLWVLPLAAFLATFILVFTERPLLNHAILQKLQPVLLCLSLLGLAVSGSNGWGIAILGSTGAFLVTTLVAHRELYLRRPGASDLTEFYLWMSLGGVTGGVFAAIIAPQIFNAIWEFPLLLVLGMACRTGVVARPPASMDLRALVRIAVLALACMLAIGIATRAGLFPANNLPLILFLSGFAGLAVLASQQPLSQFVYAAIMGMTLVILPSAMNRGLSERSFFGVHYVSTSPDKKERHLMHGTTLHGAERLVDATGNPVAAAPPSTYYYPGSPMAQGTSAARVAAGKLDAGLNVGIVGLGAGSMACNSRPGEHWRFFEIDPVVVRLARDSGHFTFLSRCQPKADIVVGDARLTLTKEAPGAFDYLVVDAFSSDSVPVHLLTVEALQLYLSRLAPNGILAMHVSTRHLELTSVVAALARAIPGTKAVLAADNGIPDGEGSDSAPSLVVFVTKTETAMQPIRVYPFVSKLSLTAVTPWTDDYSNILSAFWRRYASTRN